jgi:hypothetical protein
MEAWPFFVRGVACNSQEKKIEKLSHPRIIFVRAAFAPKIANSRVVCYTEEMFAE